MPPKEFEMGAGYLYDEEGNCLGSFESLEDIEIDNDYENVPNKRLYDKYISELNSIECQTFTFKIDDMSINCLTKKQNHLRKHSKYRVRKKYNNIIKRYFIKKCFWSSWKR